MEVIGNAKKINVGESFLQYKPNKRQSGGSRTKRDNISQLKPLTVKELLLEKLKKYKKEKSRKKHNFQTRSTLQKQIQPFSYQNNESRIPSLTSSFSQESKPLKNPKVQIPQMNHEYGRTELEYSDENHNKGLQPEYGNLKNGVKPTYRQFIKNKTMRKDNPRSRLKVEVEKKFNLGRNYTQKKVGVFIKSNEMRRIINDSKIDIQRSNMKTVKNYLKKHNLIKYGSDAPNELLREIYSSSKLCGDVFNVNGNSLVHNYMNQES